MSFPYVIFSIVITLSCYSVVIFRSLSELSESLVGVPPTIFRQGLRHRCNNCENWLRVEVFRSIKLVSCRSPPQVFENYGVTRFCRSAAAHILRPTAAARLWARATRRHAREGLAVWAALAWPAATPITGSFAISYTTRMG